MTGEQYGRDDRGFHVWRLGMTGRIALFYSTLVLLPMGMTSWMIEMGWLEPGRNIYFALPVLFLLLLLPLSRFTAHLLINRDLMVINRFCTEIKQGNYCIYFDIGNEQENEDQFLVLLRNLTWMSHGLARKHEAQQNRYQDVRKQCDIMEEQARTDGLTGLYNRRHFDELLARKAVQAARNDSPLSLLFIDCDRFKQLNDTQGHQTGDLALIQLARCMRLAIRLNCDFPFRLGGDEFAILMPETEGDEAAVVARRLRQLYSEHRFGDVTLSIGISTCRFSVPDCERQVHILVQTADQQTYTVKKKGGDGISRMAC